MKQENEQSAKADKYVLISAGHRTYLAMPMDQFIEMDGDIIILEQEGYSDDNELKIKPAPVDFKLLNADQLKVLQVKAKLAAEKEKKSID